MIGADTATDVNPSGYETLRIPIHAVGIVHMGLWLMDNMQLEDVAAAAESIRSARVPVRAESAEDYRRDGESGESAGDLLAHGHALGVMWTLIDLELLSSAVSNASLMSVEAIPVCDQGAGFLGAA